MSFRISIWTQINTDYEDLLHELYNQILAIVFLCSYTLKLTKKLVVITVGSNPEPDYVIFFPYS